jgi:hypothetical protein
MVLISEFTQAGLPQPIRKVCTVLITPRLRAKGSYLSRTGLPYIGSRHHRLRSIWRSRKTNQSECLVAVAGFHLFSVIYAALSCAAMSTFAGYSAPKFRHRHTSSKETFGPFKWIFVGSPYLVRSASIGSMRIATSFRTQRLYGIERRCSLRWDD